MPWGTADRSASPLGVAVLAVRRTVRRNDVLHGGLIEDDVDRRRSRRSRGRLPRRCVIFVSGRGGTSRPHFNAASAFPPARNLGRIVTLIDQLNLRIALRGPTLKRRVHS